MSEMEEETGRKYKRRNTELFMSISRALVKGSLEILIKITRDYWCTIKESPRIIEFPMDLDFVIPCTILGVKFCTHGSFVDIFKNSIHRSLQLFQPFVLTFSFNLTWGSARATSNKSSSNVHLRFNKYSLNHNIICIV